MPTFGSMSLFISSLNSGSNGNCFYIGNDREAILVDAGISCRETEKRMKRLGLSMTKVRAIFVSHEHSDHITGIPALSRKYQVPVYITPGTRLGSNIPIEEHLVCSFVAFKALEVGDLSITAFPKSHDANDPHSFIISFGGVTVGVFTDIGFSCKNVIGYFRKCNAAFLEANYCDDMLENGGYPYFLKKRISGDNGHLSNKQALELFTKNRAKNLSHLVLSHLSKNNNHPDLVNRLFSAHAGTTTIAVASRYEETPVFHIQPSGQKRDVQQRQLSLF